MGFLCSHDEKIQHMACRPGLRESLHAGQYRHGDSKGKEFGINKPDSMAETLAAHLGLLRLSFATASILQVILQ